MRKKDLMLLFYSFILGEEGELYIVRMVVAVAYASAHPPSSYWPQKTSQSVHRGLALFWLGYMADARPRVVFFYVC